MRNSLPGLKSLVMLAVVSMSFLKSSATTYTTSQDGNWEDSITWNNSAVLTDFTGTVSYRDTIEIKHHITFSHPLRLRFVIFLLDSGSSICGYDSIHLWNSEMIQYKSDVYCYYFYLDSSYWFCHSGFSLWRMGTKCTGENIWADSICGHLEGEGGKAMAGLIYHFECKVPPVYWQDTVPPPPPPPPPPPVYHDTVNVSVDPNQSFDDFQIKTYLSTNHTQVIAELFDLLGIKRATLRIPSGGETQTIEASNLPAGIYILRVSENDTVLRVFRLLKVR